MRSNARLPRILGNRIKRKRKLLNLTQEELAAKVGISPVYVGYIEQGRNTPSLEVLEKTAKALKIKTSELID